MISWIMSLRVGLSRQFCDFLSFCPTFYSTITYVMGTNLAYAKVVAFMSHDAYLS